LPVPYFHVVFTLPPPVAAIAFQNKAVVYAILFKSAVEAMTTLAANPRSLGAKIGGLAILHTWGQALTHHPHVHCVVPGGGLSIDGSRWIEGRANFFLAVKPLSRLFRRLFLERLQAAFEAKDLGFFGDLAYLADPAAFAAYLAAVRRLDWIVYAKKPFGGPAQVLAYLGRYTHRVAIANRRDSTQCGIWTSPLKGLIASTRSALADFTRVRFLDRTSPWPTAFDLSLQRKTEEGPNCYDAAKQADALNGERSSDGRNDVGSDEKFKSQQNASPEVRPALFVCRPPVSGHDAKAHEQ
jgi:Putative transposase